MKNELVTFLPWDTDHFGHRIGRANVGRMDKDLYVQIKASCEDLDLACLYFLADAADQASILELQRRRFIFVDIRTTLEQKITGSLERPCTSGVTVRSSSVDDLERLTAIAHDNFTSTRFFADPFLDNEKASRLYQIWLSKSVATDYADRVIVAEIDRKGIGFVTCHLNRELNEGNIGLVALAKSAQGKGLSRTMILHALEWFRDQQINSVNVVTQGHNVAAQRIYQRCGFVTRSTEVWFHKWFRDSP